MVSTSRQLLELQLHCFVKEGRLEDIKPLLKKKVNINLKTPDGTLLMTAAQRSNWDILEYLIDSGSDLYATDNGDQWTILHHASKNSWLPVAQLFVERGYNLDVKTAKNETAIMIAARYNNKCIVELLVNAGADINCCDIMNWTVLHHASSKGHIKVAQFLVEKGVNVNVQDVKGKTALHVLLGYRGDIEFICFLLRSGANCNLEDSDGNSAFNLLTLKKSLGAIRLCIERGAYVKACDYSKLVKTRLLKSIVLRRMKYCSQAIINKYNNKDLPDVYKAVSPDALPHIDNFKIRNESEYGMEVNRAVAQDIQNRGFCNLLEVRPLVLRMMCVDSFLSHVRAVEKARIAASRPNPPKRIVKWEGPSKQKCLRK